MIEAERNNEESLKSTEIDFVQLFKDNSDIFQRHPELLELVSFSDSRGTASLLEKQVATLKQRIQKIRSQQSEFFEVARENEQISDSFASIIGKLIAYQNLSEFAAEFPATLRATFGIDEVSFKTAVAVARRPSENEAYDDAVGRLPSKQAVCDNRWPRAVIDLFFASVRSDSSASNSSSSKKSNEIKSAALIPMKHREDGDIIGIIALGSNDPERYNHDLGTAHLTRLGLMAGICLNRLQPKS